MGQKDFLRRLWNGQMSMSPDLPPPSTDITVVCHVRAPLLFEPIDRQIETVQACESEGAVGSVLIRSWPDQVTISEDSPNGEVLEVFDRFRRWADSRGVSIEPPFRRRTVTSPITDESKRILTTPVLCLALYRDGQLVGVYPHSADDETITTNEVIGSLRTGEVPTTIGSRPVEAAPDGNGCPACGGDILNGQGLATCVDCDWNGTISGEGSPFDVTWNDLVGANRHLSDQSGDRHPTESQETVAPR